VPAFGSSLTIDDLKVNPNQLRTQAFDQAPFTIWPTIAGNEINILKNGDDSSVHEFTIIDIQGKIVSEQRLKPNNGIASKIDIGALLADCTCCARPTDSPQNSSKSKSIINQCDKELDNCSSPFIFSIDLFHTFTQCQYNFI
jgi:hypothetical protein